MTNFGKSEEKFCREYIERQAEVYLNLLGQVNTNISTNHQENKVFQLRASNHGHTLRITAENGDTDNHITASHNKNTNGTRPSKTIHDIISNHLFIFLSNSRQNQLHIIWLKRRRHSSAARVAPNSPIAITRQGYRWFSLPKLD